MMDLAVTPEGPEARFTVDQYFRLVDEGDLHPDDRIELLEGVVVAMSPQNPRHSAALNRADHALRHVLADRAVVRVQSPLVLGSHSAPEPDIAVVPGPVDRYDDSHPTTALLIVEVADASLVQDRITKSAIYARADVPEYWIVNLRDDVVEVHRSPDPKAGQYREVSTSGRGEQLTIAALGPATVAIDDILPRKV